MKSNSMRPIREALSDERGQTLPLMAVLMVAMLGMGGLTIDVGHAYVVRGQLQIATNAAALAAAGVVYNTSQTDNVTTYANSYGSAALGNKNFSPAFQNIQTSVSSKCLEILSGKGSCVSGATSNAVQVTQKATVTTYFMALFGVKQLSLSATATASMLGVAQPWNVAIILDATPSMGNKDPYCAESKSYTAEQCAMAGIQTMLKGIDPCIGATTTCAPTSANSYFRVSLFSFPNVTTATVSRDYDCSGKANAAIYSLPAIPASDSTTGYQPIAYTGTSKFTATYQITPPNIGNADANGFLSDYYMSSNVGGLDSSSILVKAVGNGTTKGCLTPPSNYPGSGGETYFASAIYAAQAALQSERAASAQAGVTSKNAIIFVSDGQANTNYSSYPQKTSTASSAGTGGVSVTSSGTSSQNLTGALNTFGIYPDFHNDCQQAIMAAQYAINAGTRFYSVAYGSESGGCSTESNVVVTGSLNVPISSSNQVVPCLVMEDMASSGLTADSPWYFYTDGSSQANGCTDSKHTSSNLSSIFGAIAATFTKPRLLPNNAT